MFGKACGKFAFIFYHYSYISFWSHIKPVSMKTFPPKSASEGSRIDKLKMGHKCQGAKTEKYMSTFPIVFYLWEIFLYILLLQLKIFMVPYQVYVHNFFQPE